MTRNDYSGTLNRSNDIKTAFEITTKGKRMTATEQTQLGKTLWAIADDLRGSMNADDFRDYMLSFLFLRYLSDNYEASAKKELGRDYPVMEFRDSGEWEEKQLEGIGEFIGGGTPDTTKSEYWEGEIQWYTPTEIKEGNLKRSIRTITEEGLKNSSAKLLPKGALLITTRATIGDIGIANNECATNQGFQSLVVKASEINHFWFYWIIQHKKELIRKASGSTFPEIGKNEIEKIKAFRPSKKEQQKIATCLSSLDDLITSQTEKIEVLKVHKKGLMQGLFPA